MGFYPTRRSTLADGALVGGRARVGFYPTRCSPHRGDPTAKAGQPARGGGELDGAGTEGGAALQVNAGPHTARERPGPGV